MITRMLAVCIGSLSLTTLALSQAQTQDATRPVQDPSKETKEIRGVPHYVSLDKLNQAEVRLTPDMEERAEAAEDNDLAEGAKGSIQDFIISQPSCEITAAAVSVGGLLGMGDKIALVPIYALEYTVIDEKPAFHLHMTKDEVENLAEFDIDAAREDGKVLDTTVARAEAAFPRRADRAEAEAATPRDMDTDKEKHGEMEAGMPQRMLASQIDGCTVVGTDGKFGEITDAAIDINRNHVCYLLVQKGGVLEMGGTTYVIPAKALHATRVDEKPALRAAKTKAQLESAVVYVDTENDREFLTAEVARRADEFFGTQSKGYGAMKTDKK